MKKHTNFPGTQTSQGIKNESRPALWNSRCASVVSSAFIRSDCAVVIGDTWLSTWRMGQVSI